MSGPVPVTTGPPDPPPWWRVPKAWAAAAAALVAQLVTAGQCSMAWTEAEGVELRLGEVQHELVEEVAMATAVESIADEERARRHALEGLLRELAPVLESCPPPGVE